jgi:hypothetical protein
MGSPLASAAVPEPLAPPIFDTALPGALSMGAAKAGHAEFAWSGGFWAGGIAGIFVVVVLSLCLIRQIRRRNGVLVRPSSASDHEASAFWTDAERETTAESVADAHDPLWNSVGSTADVPFLDPDEAFLEEDVTDVVGLMM